MFSDGFDVGDFNFVAGICYRRAGNYNDTSEYYRVQEGSITMPSPARKVLAFRTMILGKSRIRGIPAFFNVGSGAQDSNENERGSTVLSEVKSFCCEYPGATVVTGGTRARDIEQELLKYKVVGVVGLLSPAASYTASLRILKTTFRSYQVSRRRICT